MWQLNKGSAVCPEGKAIRKNTVSDRTCDLPCTIQPL